MDTASRRWGREMKKLPNSNGVSSRTGRGFIALHRGFIALSRGFIAPTICKPAWILALRGKAHPLPFYYLFFTGRTLWIKALRSHNKNPDCACGAQGGTMPSKIKGQPADPLEAGGEARTRLSAPAIPFPSGNVRVAVLTHFLPRP